ncbi:MAG: hypothetical protein ACFE96_16035 [Candidatus Hermodarchaeota archaeon]
MKSKNIKKSFFLILIIILIGASLTSYNFNATQSSKEFSEVNTIKKDLTIPKTSGTDIAICTEINHQRGHVICSDGLGGVIVAWVDNRSGSLAIYAQRIDSTGAVKWTPNGTFISDTSENFYTEIDICSDGVGGAILTWYNYTGGGDSDIYAQRIDSDGIIQWTPQEGVPVCIEGSEQVSARLCSDGNEGAIIAWHDERDSWSIYGQQIDSNGAPKWTGDGKRISPSLGTLIYTLKICSDDKGGAIIVWTNGTFGEFDILAQRVNSTGYINWTANGEIVCNAINDQVLGKICEDNLGGAFIVWEDKRNGPYDIYAQQINSSGKGQWTKNGEAICTADNEQRGAALCRDGLGGAIIAWDDDRINVDDVYAQRINSTGHAQWIPDGTLISSAEGENDDIEIAGDGLGGAFITWEYENYGDYDIYAQHIDSTGTTVWTDNGLAICTVNNYQFNPQIYFNETGFAIIVWYDYRNSNYDIYAQIIPTLRNLEVDLISQSYSTEQFNITFAVYNEKDQKIESAIFQMWWNSTDVSGDIINLDDGLYFVSLTPITVASGDDPILLNMTISSLGYYDLYYETSIAVEAYVLCVDIIDQFYSDKYFNMTFYVFDAGDPTQGIEGVGWSMKWNGTDVAGDIVPLGGGNYSISLTPIFVETGGDPIRLNGSITAPGFAQKDFEYLIDVEAYVLCVDIIDQFYSDKYFNLTFYVFDAGDPTKGIEGVIWSLNWNGTDVTGDIIPLGGGDYRISLIPITVEPSEEPISLQGSITALGFNQRYFQFNISIDPEIIDKVTKPGLPPPSAGDDDDDDDDEDTWFEVFVVVVVVLGCVAAGLSVIYILTKKRIIHKPRR